MSLQRTTGLRPTARAGHDGGVRAAGDDEPVSSCPAPAPTRSR